METFFKKNLYILTILLILLVAGSIRLYKLGTIPHGMTWDEAAIGYNGYAILHTRRDEWLEKLPVSFMSFGDYKAPFAIYLNGVFTYLFGMNLLAVRLPFALASILAIAGLFLLAHEIFKERSDGKYLTLFSGFILTLSPWHIHYSRAGFESGMALSFFIWGLYLLLLAFRQNFKNLLINMGWMVFFTASIYTYHSSKVVVPLVGIVFFLLFYKKILPYIKSLLLPISVFISMLIPFITDSLFGEGLTRAGVTIFSSDISALEKCKYVVDSLLIHLSPEFLLLGQTTTLRHGTGYLGVLFITTFLLFLAGVVSVWKAKKLSEYAKLRLLFLAITLFGILPASIALEVPHSNRALLALPGFIVLAAFGLEYSVLVLKKLKSNAAILGSHKEKDILVKSFVGTLIAVHILFAISFLSHYFTTFSRTSAGAFNDGYLEAFEIAQRYEKGLGVEPVDKIIFTSKYGQPYIYALFVRKTNPIWYQGGSLVKYEFYDTLTVDDLNRQNALVVGSGFDKLPTENADHVVYGSDGLVRFQIFRTK